MNNPPAFPVANVKTITELRDREIEREAEGQRGMTLRDYFAAAVISSLWNTAYNEKNVTRDNIVGEAYSIADAMLKAREQ